MLAFDERYAPLVLIVSWGEHDAADFDLYFAKFGEWHAAKKRWLVLNDTRAQSMPNAYARKRYAELADAIETEMPGVTCANAAVLGSALFVGAARAVNWLRKRSDDKTHYCNTAMEGLAWLTERGTPLGLVVPAEATAIVRELDAYARAGKNPGPLVG